MSSSTVESTSYELLPPRKPKIGSGEVHLWYGTYDDMQEHVQQVSRVLSDTERMRAEKYRFPIDQRRFVVRHSLLRTLIGWYLSMNPGDIQFGVNHYGKPYIINTPQKIPFEFSMSNSNEMVLYAFSCCRRLGIDIEYMRSMEDMNAIVERFFSPTERAEFDALPNNQKQEAFYKGWTLKEAFVKALGEGLSRSLNQFDVSLKPGASARLKRTAWDQYEAGRWFLKTITLVPGYMAALAVERKGGVISLTAKRIKFEDGPYLTR